MVVTGDAVVGEAVFQIGTWIKGLGTLAVIIAAYSVTMFLINRKQAKDLDEIKQELGTINNKLDKLTKKK